MYKLYQIIMKDGFKPISHKLLMLYLDQI